MSVLNPNRSPLKLHVEPTLSKFKLSELRMLNSPVDAYRLPMAVIALLDMNAFFAQCEQVRLGRTLEDPVVCCQWSSLIAVSYAARKYGIGRMDTLQSAKDKCPGLIVGHAAVFRKGETHWQYLDSRPDQALHKVSLDPYRRELRKVFKILSRECDLVEKASVDECYMDLGRLVFGKLIEIFPFLTKLDEDDTLPQIPQVLPEELKWEGKVFATGEEDYESNDAIQANYSKVREKKSISMKDGETESDTHAIIEDWDDICTLIGSQFLFKIRQEVFKELNYTTSGGVATTKTVAKLAAGLVKPDFQTIIRPKAIHSFLHTFELSDITQMGGQLGERLKGKLTPPDSKHSITYIRENWSLPELKSELPDEQQVAEHVFSLCHGEFQQEIKQRTAVKSMLSRKNFQERQPVKTIRDCYDWLRVYVGDLYGRLIELDDENMNLSLLQKNGCDKDVIYRPRTVSVHITTTSWTRMSRQTQFPVIKDLEKLRSSLELTVFRLLCEIMDNCKATGDDVKFKNLRVNDEHLDQIHTPSLANMGVGISNFVTTSDSSLIDSYTLSKGQALDKEDLKRLFDEVNQPKRDNSTKEATRLRHAQKINPYVKQLFQEFERETSASSKIESAPKQKADFKEDKDYVNKMFEDYQTSVMVERASNEVLKSPELSSESQRKARSSKSSFESSTNRRAYQDIGATLVLLSDDSKDVSNPEDIFLSDMIQTRQCKECNQPVEDVFEHRDYHLALKLSSELNGNSTIGTNHRRKPLAQSKLPFSGSK